MRKLAVFALPVTALALAGVMMFSQVIPAPASPELNPAGAPSLARLTPGHQTETGAATAVILTNWQETNDGSTIVPSPNPPGPKR